MQQRLTMRWESPHGDLLAREGPSAKLTQRRGGDEHARRGRAESTLSKELWMEIPEVEMLFAKVKAGQADYIDMVLTLD